MFRWIVELSPAIRKILARRSKAALAAVSGCPVAHVLPTRRSRALSLELDQLAQSVEEAEGFG